MLLATLLALSAAVLHAGWNLLARQATDPQLALLGQFLVAGVIGALGVVATGGVPAAAWTSAAASGLIHVPYVLGLGLAYRAGDFSLAYPVARGGGALIAAVGGIVLLGDEPSAWQVTAVATVVGGMVLLGRGAPRRQLAIAVAVAVTIGGYTIVDSQAVRAHDAIAYVFATHAATGGAMVLAAAATGRVRVLVGLGTTAWGRIAVAAAMSILTYGLVLVAVRQAPVGYVAAIRESSILIAVVVGWRWLGERPGASRAVAAGLVFVGLIALVVVR